MRESSHVGPLHLQYVLLSRNPKVIRTVLFSPVSLGKLEEYSKKMEVFDITTRQLNTLLVAMYLDPNLVNHKLWDDEHDGLTVRNRAEVLLRAEVVKEINKIRRPGI